MRKIYGSSFITVPELGKGKIFKRNFVKSMQRFSWPQKVYSIYPKGFLTYRNVDLKIDQFEKDIKQFMIIT